MEVQFNPNTLLYELGDGTTSFTPEQDLNLRYFVSKNKKKPTGKEFMFTTSHAELVVMPNLREFLAEVSKDPKRSRLLRLKVGRVMEEVAHGKTLGLWPDDEKLGTTSFQMTDVGSQGMMRLQTFGACACYRTEMSGFSVRSPQPEVLTNLSMPIGMSPHNIESDLQRKTVLAGAASVAWFAKNGFEANTGRSSAADHIDS